MNNKKGFTLVELLAVIVLLAAIMILVYPNVLEKVNEQKKGIDLKKEKLLYTSTYEYLYERKADYPLSEGKTYCVKIADIAKDNKLYIDDYGDLIDTGYVQVQVGKGGNLQQSQNAYRILTDKSSCNGTTIESEIVYEVGSFIYFNPGTKEQCLDYQVSNSAIGNKTGCMKWYVLSNMNNQITLLLDHDTTAMVAYNSTGNNSVMGEIKTELDELVSIYGWKYSPRPITVAEISAVVGKDLAINESLGNNFEWLYSMEESATEDGYWTSTPYQEYIWVVSHDGYITYSNVDDYAGYGLRPVISIPESLLK